MRCVKLNHHPFQLSSSALHFHHSRISFKKTAFEHHPFSPEALSDLHRAVEANRIQRLQLFPRAAAHAAAVTTPGRSEQCQCHVPQTLRFLGLRTKPSLNRSLERVNYWSMSTPSVVQDHVAWDKTWNSQLTCALTCNKNNKILSGPSYQRLERHMNKTQGLCQQCRAKT